MKKKLLLIPLSAALLLLFFRAAPPPSYEEMIDSYEQAPPIVKHVWVQKLASTMPDGSNMLMKVEYEDGTDLPDHLDVYYGLNGGASVTFYNNGDGADVTASDKIFSAYLTEDITAFVTQMENMENALTEKGSFLEFKGHVGRLVTDLPTFNSDQFLEGIEIELDARLINGVDCGSELKKENSLFITDLSVVEDPARTFNVATRQGNPWGAWTFGQLMKNMANEYYTGVSARTFLKNWLTRWTDSCIVNGQTIPARRRVLNVLIGPWLQRAHQLDPVPYPSDYYQHLDTSYTRWKTDWDNTNQDSLLKYAPFKLMAIVNRMDLRGSVAYRPSLSNAGETRFIYTLVAPFALSSDHFPSVPAGQPPMASDGIGGDFCTMPRDWKGMNVILEYGNPFSEACDVRDFAQQWLDLSALSLDSSSYRTALQLITDQVTAASAVMGKVNGSAINQVRTNERIFMPTDCDGFKGGTSVFQGWFDSDWELSQFEIDNFTASPTFHSLVPVPVALTPMNASNSPTNYRASTTFAAGVSSAGTRFTYLSPGSEPPGSIALIEWLLTPPHNISVNLGNYLLPLSYTYAGDEFKLSATARMDMDQLHYWDLPWYTASTTHYTHIDINDPGQYLAYRDIRHQLSLNTCQGCHGGETKTVFTQMEPVGYGQSGDYWSSTPYTDYQGVDIRPLNGYFSGNTGASSLNGSSQGNYVSSTPDRYFSRLSGFLTGRSFSGTTPAGTWDDDNDSDAGDDQMTGLYYVYSPTNKFDAPTDADSTYPKPQSWFGYNDLEMRKKRLCQFVNMQCGMPTTKIPFMLVNLTQLPLIANGH